MKKVIIITLAIIFFFVLGTVTYGYVRDLIIVNNAKTTLNWIENYYTNNGKYPNSQEFSSKFPNFKIADVYKNIGYYAREDGSDFTFSYITSKTRNFAVGQALYTGGGWMTSSKFLRYVVEACPRWNGINDNMNSMGGIGYELVISPTTLYYNHINYTDTNSLGNHTSGRIRVDLNPGKVYFRYELSGAVTYPNDGEILLLDNLSKPRIFSSKNENEIFITDGNDIFSYILLAGNKSMKLIDKKKIGSVPSGCPSL